MISYWNMEAMSHSPCWRLSLGTGLRSSLRAWYAATRARTRFTSLITAEKGWLAAARRASRSAFRVAAYWQISCARLLTSFALASSRALGVSSTIGGVCRTGRLRFTAEVDCVLVDDAENREDRTGRLRFAARAGCGWTDEGDD